MSTELMKTLNGISESFEKFRERNDARMELITKRLDAADEAREQAEALLDRPHASGSKLAAGIRAIKTSNGTAYEIPSNLRLADVPALRQKQSEISLQRWLGAVVAGERSADREALEFVREQKAVTTASTGVLIPAEYQAQWTDLMRAQSVLVKAGMRTVTMTGATQVHSAITADPTASWHSEGSSINAANPTFAARTLTARTLVTRCQATVELAQDSPDFGAQLARVMTGAMAAELDRVGLEGSGTPPEPTGIRNTSGRNSQTSTGALTSYSKIITGLGQLLASNCDLAQITKFAIMNPLTWAQLENIATGIASDKSQLARPRSIEAMEFLVTSNIRGNAASSPQVPAALYLGDFRDLTFGTRMEASVEVLKLDTYAGNLILEFVGYLRGDFACMRPASFATIEGILA